MLGKHSQRVDTADIAIREVLNTTDVERCLAVVVDLVA